MINHETAGHGAVLRQVVDRKRGVPGNTFEQSWRHASFLTHVSNYNSTGAQALIDMHDSPQTQSLAKITDGIGKDMSSV